MIFSQESCTNLNYLVDWVYMKEEWVVIDRFGQETGKIVLNTAMLDKSDYHLVVDVRIINHDNNM